MNIVFVEVFIPETGLFLKESAHLTQTEALDQAQRLMEKGLTVKITSEGRETLLFPNG